MHSSQQRIESGTPITFVDFAATPPVEIPPPRNPAPAQSKKRIAAKPAKPVSRLEVRKSGVHGHGVYATTTIRKGARVIEYTGALVPWEDASDQADGPHTFLFGLTDGKQVIDPAFGGNDARWINHSCDPNCEAIEEGDRVFIYALRSLLPGEELFYDYALDVDEPRTRKLEKEYACHCGSPQCRGFMLAPV